MRIDQLLNGNNNDGPPPAGQTSEDEVAAGLLSKSRASSPLSDIASSSSSRSRSSPASSPILQLVPSPKMEVEPLPPDDMQGIDEEHQGNPMEPESEQEVEHIPQPPPQPPAFIEYPFPTNVSLQQRPCLEAWPPEINVTSCTSCASAGPGERTKECAFDGVRILYAWPGDQAYRTMLVSDLQSPPPTLNWRQPKEFVGVKTTSEGIRPARHSVAKALFPLVQEEIRHLLSSNAIMRTLEPWDSVTCDACLTGILSGGRMCGICGQELCLECFKELQRIPPGGTTETFVQRCCGETIHDPSSFASVARQGMKTLLKTYEDLRTQLGDDENAPPDRATLRSLMEDDPIWSNAKSRKGDSRETDEPTLAFAWLDGTDVRSPLKQSEGFSQIWSNGEPVLIDITPSSRTRNKLLAQWNPGRIAEMHGSDPCSVVDGKGKARKTTLKAFLDPFGTDKVRWMEGKLKDWPPNKKFVDHCPTLAKEFHDLLPAGFAIAPAGILNLAAHVPTNANPPDLGPKGYMARASSDSDGSLGSTRLHTVNVLVWSSSPTRSAVWDIYRPEDTEQICSFLYQLLAEENEISLDEARRRFDHPIHTQRRYLGPTLRRRLRLEHDVTSYRIYQGPGQVVLLPAGSAHQVCNLADCVKLASDFVSPENLDRSFDTSHEFRLQTREGIAWREDILQLKRQLWYAWLEETDVEKVSILGSESIHCGFHLIPYIVHTVLSTLPSSAYVLITDTNLSTIFLDSFESAFATAIKDLPAVEGTAKPRWLSKTIPPGEGSKSREMKAVLEDFLLEHRCTRDTVVLALGGGVVGDLVGFVSANFMRGVRYCQIPTTLLAMVDSAVGGKTAIDTPLGKNLIGAFHQPSYVFIDASFLETLPRREFVNGMAEVVKTAAIWDEVEFAKLEAGQAEIHSAVNSGSTRRIHAGRTLSTRTHAQSLLLSVIRASIATKAHIVTIDEKETGLRNLVNFGHTVGHAIEAVMTPDVLHGECVAVGMLFEAEVARSLGVLGNAAIGRLARCIKAHGLPTSLSDPVFTRSPKAAGLRVDALLEFMKVDKKNAGTAKKVVLLSRIGRTYEERATAVEDAVIARVLSPAARVHPGPPSHAHFQLQTPGSKSISNRALVLAALAEGTCKLSNLLHSDDTQVMMGALEQMQGAEFSWEDNGETLVVNGGKGKLSPPKDGKEIYLGNAGTASRFVATVCALAEPAAHGERTIITGNARMKQRPIGPLVEALVANGSSVQYVEAKGSLPLSIAAQTQGFRGGHIQLAASISSQYVSSILLCAPYAKEEILLELTGGAVISQPYIDMTIAMMADFGIKVERLSGDKYRIPLGLYKSPATYTIESDASSATYPLALAAITGTSCTLRNIGSASIQGDARFAKEVLEPMGCTVEQSANETTVTGPPVGKLRALGYVDMEPMTDAFLTAAALAAVATLAALPGRTKEDQPRNSTRIGGVANQRVKECNRIEAMRTQLAKFGVLTRELDDGIEVLGIVPGELKKGASIHCFDDHRVAMAFSVLAAVPGGPSAIIEEKRCVEKTWPSWWDDLYSKIGIRVDGVDLSEAPTASTSKAPGRAQRHSTDASIFVLGMRGAGKTHISRIGARALGWQILDADEEFKTTTGQTAKEFVADFGWPRFRVQETVILKEIIRTRSKGYVVSLGGGVIETAENREILDAYGHGGGPILHIVRHIDEILAYLNSEPTRPSLGEDLRSIYTRRWPWYHSLSNFEFTNIFDIKPKEAQNPLLKESQPAPISSKAAEDEVARFFRFMTGTAYNRVDISTTRGHHTHLLELNLPSYTRQHPALSGFEEVIAGVDAIEARIDLLLPKSGLPTVPFVATQLANLRQRSTAPIVYTVRTISRGGAFPDGEEDALFALLELGVKAGCEYIDVESHLDPARVQAFLAEKQGSKIIASYHDVTGRLRWGSEAALDIYDRLSQYGDIVKMVGRASSMNANLEMLKFRESVQEGKPLITYNIGTEGELSRVLSPVLGPVTHPLLPAPSQPGAVTFAQVQQALHILGRLPKKQFYLFGTPIAHSKSPLMHNTAFKLLGLPDRKSVV